MDFFYDYYLFIKFLHIVALIAWMAGLFYLPRLFVYHSLYPENGEMLKIMENKLYKIIMVPSMYVTIISGFLLIFIGNFLSSGWMHLKITCVFFMIVFQFQLNSFKKQLATGNCRKSSKFFRVINEIPTLILIIVVFLVIFKPF